MRGCSWLRETSRRSATSPATHGPDGPERAAASETFLSLTGTKLKDRRQKGAATAMKRTPAKRRWRIVLLIVGKLAGRGGIPIRP
mmetsp:Transcript_72307/g.157016  ORF Transcript_72307/g.157016 Transcript_72307/m.157016 type:complete len:85 (+) Transcript_72307:739-993(+)